MALSEEEAIKDLSEEEVEDLRETFRTFDKVKAKALKYTCCSFRKSKFPFLYVLRPRLRHKSFHRRAPRTSSSVSCVFPNKKWGAVDAIQTGVGLCASASS